MTLFMILAAPGVVLQDHAIAVVVLESSTANVPVRIGRCYALKADRFHSDTGALPFFGLRHIKDGKVFRRWSRRHRAVSTVGELEVISRSLISNHDTIETLMVFERSKYPKI